jgi:hypothetical protein
LAPTETLGEVNHVTFLAGRPIIQAQRPAHPLRVIELGAKSGNAVDLLAMSEGIRH